MADSADDLIAMFGKITTNDHDTLIEQFSRILRVDQHTATFFLEASDWSVEVAVQNFLVSTRGGQAVSAFASPQAVFTGDLSAFQAQHFQPNTPVHLQLSFRNVGAEAWPHDTHVVFVDGENPGGAQSVPIACGPGEECAAVLNFLTPGHAGTFAGTWRLVCSAGYFGDPLWIILTVAQPSGAVQAQQHMEMQAQGWVPPQQGVVGSAGGFDGAHGNDDDAMDM